jgi:cytochrome c oxidase subunit 2
MKKLLLPVALAAFAAFACNAFAAPYESIAKPWQLGFHEPASPVMEKLDKAHDFLLVVITVITVFVLVMLTYICIRFRRKANPVPSKTAHNTKLEIIWTAIPILILVVIAIPTLRVHYYMQNNVDAEMTIKAVGHQWYWHYEYPDHGGFKFDSYMIKDADLKPGDHRLLSVDNRMVVPVNTKIKIQLTGADVIHAWAMPAFGVKRDAVPGRLNETWFEATKIGTFYGQCSELCGVGHGFMPIVVDVVSKEEFDGWVKKKQQEAGVTTAAAVAAPNGKDSEKKPADAAKTEKSAQ